MHDRVTYVCTSAWDTLVILFALAVCLIYVYTLSPLACCPWTSYRCIIPGKPLMLMHGITKISIPIHGCIKDAHWVLEKIILAGCYNK